MEKETIIHAVTIFLPTTMLKFEVGKEAYGRAIIEIEPVVNESKYELRIIGEDEELICSIDGIEDTPVVYQYKTIVVDGPIGD
ncbi:hypothetical protein [Paenibacillus sp. L3-i20]|uniref:hypothetical protein n=1 Tax=Paenibacillus sp. L3-i20 TaxID=2905833 RepID=UPI001EDD5FED|nr:hypothetical protein [Paenibacillus sp. L3-i20]GKU79818.1 hypothetical protein L3i20_v242150 [Paenibacillus sp. L3-i20]